MKMILFLTWILSCSVMAETIVDKDEFDGTITITAKVKTPELITTIFATDKEADSRIVLILFLYLGDKWDQLSNTVERCYVKCDSTTFTLRRSYRDSEVRGATCIEKYAFVIFEEDMIKITEAKQVKMRYGTRVIKFNGRELQMALSDVWKKTEELRGK